MFSASGKPGRCSRYVQRTGVTGADRVEARRPPFPSEEAATYGPPSIRVLFSPARRRRKRRGLQRGRPRLLSLVRTFGALWCVSRIAGEGVSRYIGAIHLLTGYGSAQRKGNRRQPSGGTLTGTFLPANRGSLPPGDRSAPPTFFRKIQALGSASTNS